MTFGINKVGLIGGLSVVAVVTVGVSLGVLGYCCTRRPLVRREFLDLSGPLAKTNHDAIAYSCTSPRVTEERKLTVGTKVTAGTSGDKSNTPPEQSLSLAISTTDTNSRNTKLTTGSSVQANLESTRSTVVVRILHLGDLHLHNYSHHLVRFLRQVERDLDFDLVVSTGDNLSYASSLGQLRHAYLPLLKYPGAFVFGSHDYYETKAPKIWRYFLKRKKRKRKRAPNLPYEQIRKLFCDHGWLDLNNQSASLEVKVPRVELTPEQNPGKPNQREIPGARQLTSANCDQYESTESPERRAMLVPKTTSPNQKQPGSRSGSLLPAGTLATSVPKQQYYDKVRLVLFGVDDPHIRRDNFCLLEQSINEQYESRCNNKEKKSEYLKTNVEENLKKADDFSTDARKNERNELELRLALTHAPYVKVLGKLAKLGAQLILAGHTHGGQVRLAGRAFTSNCDLSPKYSRGLSKLRWTADGIYIDNCIPRARSSNWDNKGHFVYNYQGSKKRNPKVNSYDLTASKGETNNFQTNLAKTKEIRYTESRGYLCSNYDPGIKSSSLSQGGNGASPQLNLGRLGYTRAKVPHDTTYLNVTAGLGSSPYFPFRLGCPPEVSLLEIRI